MRLRLKLKSTDYSPIPINYNYALSSAIYKLIKLGSPEFASFLHDIGFKLNGRSYKLFTFALKFEDFKVEGNLINLLSPYAYLYISSPLIDDFVKNFIIGTFQNQKIELFADFQKSVFVIYQAELVPVPVLNSEIKFNLLSPIVLSTYKEINGQKKQYYLRYDDDIEVINRVFNLNLQNKYKIIHNAEYKGEGVALTWDESFINKSLDRKKRISRKITITKSLENPIDIIAIQSDFIVKGDFNLVKIGYECGFGEKNSMGFGMAEVIR